MAQEMERDLPASSEPALTSIAVSLRRIADSLERGIGTISDPKALGKLALDVAEEMAAAEPRL